MPARSAPRLRIAICGGGIGGLTLALVLHRYAANPLELDIDIFETAPSLTQIGAGITMWPRSWKLMRELGLDVELGECMRSPPQESPEISFRFRRSDRGNVGSDFYDSISPYGSITIHRGDFATVLARHLPKGVRIHHSKRLRSYTNVRFSADGETSDNGGQGRRIVRMFFEDGTTHEADVLIGVDGVKSATRETMYRGFAERAPTWDTSLRTDTYFAPIAPERGAQTPESAVSSPEDGLLPLPYFPVEYESTPFPPASFVPSQPAIPHTLLPRRGDGGNAIYGMTKEQLLSYVAPIWTGTYAYRSLLRFDNFESVPLDHAAHHLPMMYLGKNKHVITYPITQGKCINLVGLASKPIDMDDLKPHPKPWTLTSSKDEFQDEYDGFEGDVATLLSCASEVSRWSIHVVRPLPTWIDGNVVLLGDAAHAMTTHLGTGSGQAIEDAYVLGRLLADSRTTIDTLATALQVYESIRLPWTRDVARCSYRAGLLYQFNAGPGQHLYTAGRDTPSTSPKGTAKSQAPLDVSAGSNSSGVPHPLCDDDACEAEVLKAHGSAIDDMWRWQWIGSPEDHWKAARTLFAAELNRSAGRAS